MVVRKLKDRTDVVQGSGSVSKLSDRVIPKLESRQQASIGSGKSRTVKNIRDKQRQERLYNVYADAFQKYKKGFDAYSKERDEYVESVSEWKEKEERTKEFNDMNDRYNDLIVRLRNLNAATRGRFGIGDPELDKMKKSLGEEKLDLSNIESEQEQRITGLDIAAGEKLKDFSYYEGQGYVKGPVQAYGKVVGGTGTSTKFLPTGTYETYDPESGELSRFEAQPQSTKKAPVITYEGKTYSGEEFKNVSVDKPVQEVIGQGFDFKKYSSDPSWTVSRDEAGNVSSIFQLSPQGYKREEFIVSKGKVKRRVERDLFQPYLGESTKKSYERQAWDYDESGLLKSYSRNAPVTDRDDRVIVPKETKTYDSGILSKQRTNVYGDRSRITWFMEQDYSKGTAREWQFRKDAPEENKYYEIGRNVVSDEYKKVAKSVGARAGVKLDARFVTAKPGEKVRTSPFSFQDVTGQVQTTRIPIYNPAKEVSKENVYFGTYEKAKESFEKIPFVEKFTNPQLESYRGSVIGRLQAEQQEWRSRPAYTVRTPELKRKGVVVKKSRAIPVYDRYEGGVSRSYNNKPVQSQTWMGTYKNPVTALKTRGIGLGNLPVAQQQILTKKVKQNPMFALQLEKYEKGFTKPIKW